MPALIDANGSSTFNNQALACIAEDGSQRYKRAAISCTGDMNDVPQRL